MQNGDRRGYVERFLGWLALGKGAGGLGRARLFSGGKGFPFIMDPTTRGKPASIFLFCQDIGRTSIRTRHIGCITHTPTTSTTTTISYVNNTTAVESPTPTLSTDTHTQARRSWHQEGPAARRAAKYWLSGISPRLFLSRLCRCQRSLLLPPAPHQPSNQENRHT